MVEKEKVEVQTQEQPETASTQAKERAAIVLEVLAGTLQPQEAAQQLGVNPPAYYNLESRALQGLVQGCESRAKGPGQNYQKQIRDLQEANQKLVREARRYQSLTRAAQKAIGLMQERQESSAAKHQPISSISKTGKRAPRKVRAQRAADRLRGKTRKKSNKKTNKSLQKTGA